VEDPGNREVRLIGHGRFDRQWFERMALRKEVAFVAPRTRGAAASIDLRVEGTDKLHGVVELIPSVSGDPLLAGHAPIPMNQNSVVLSAAAGRTIGAAKGDMLKASVRRKRAGQWSRVYVALRVIGVVPDRVFPRKAAFVAPALLTAVEDYRDGYAVPELGWLDGEDFVGSRYYSGFRLYTRSLDDVMVVRDLLTAEGQGLEVSTKAKSIADVKLLDRYLTASFAMIAFIGVAGYLLSFGASMWVTVDRKRRELSVLQLLGFRSSVIMLFPIVQSGLIALCGGVVSIVLFWLISILINDYFAREAGQLQGLCRLLPWHLVAALVGTLICAVISSAVAAYRTTRIEPARGLREL